MKAVLLGALVGALVIFCWWMLSEVDRLSKLEREAEDLRGKLRASRETSHLLALSIGGAKREFPTLKLDLWVEAQVEAAKAAEAEKRRAREDSA